MLFDILLLLTACFVLVITLSIAVRVLLFPFIFARWARSRGKRKAAARERKARVRVLSKSRMGADYIGSGVIVRPPGTSAHPILRLFIRAVGLIILAVVVLKLWLH